jgi:hypothetical protein
MNSTQNDQIINILNELSYVDIKPFSHNIIAMEISILEKDYGEQALKILFNRKKKMWTEKGWGHCVEKYST